MDSGPPLNLSTSVKVKDSEIQPPGGIAPGVVFTSDGVIVSNQNDDENAITNIYASHVIEGEVIQDNGPDNDIIGKLIQFSL